MRGKLLYGKDLAQSLTHHPEAVLDLDRASRLLLLPRPQHGVTPHSKQEDVSRRPGWWVGLAPSTTDSHQ